MNPYILTVGFLMLMSLFTSSEVIRYTTEAKENAWREHALALDRNCSYLEAQGKVDDFMLQEGVEDITPNKIVKKREKSKGGTRKSRTLQFNFDRPPHNSRLNVFQLLHPEKLPLGLPKEFSLYETAAHLMRVLYKETWLYEQGCEYKILEELMRLREQTLAFKDPEELASLVFEEEKWHTIFAAMLQGDDTVPSLLHYITFDQALSQKGGNRKINLMFADPLLLQALFSTREDVAQKLIEARDAIWGAIMEQENRGDGKEGRQHFKDALTVSVERIFSEANLNVEKHKKLFDFSLGQYGKTYFIKDKESGIVKRVRSAP